MVVFTGLVPNYGALDRIATQWFYLSLINSIGLLYFLFVGDFKKYATDLLNINLFSILCLCFMGVVFIFLCCKQHRSFSEIC